MLDLGRALRASTADGQRRSALGRSELACIRTLGWRCCLGAEGGSRPAACFSPLPLLLDQGKLLCAARHDATLPCGLVAAPGVAGTRGRGL